MTESRRDAGLVRVVGPWGLAANMVNTVVGAGIFAVPAALAASVGAYAPLVFLLCGVAVGAVAICFAEGGSRLPTSGGAYGYIEAAFGPPAGYVAGTLLWFGDVLACGSVVAALAAVVASVLPPPFATAGRAAVIVGVIGGIALVNIGGVSNGARLINAMAGLKMIPLALFVVAGVPAIHGSNLMPAGQPSLEGLGRAAILALFAFTGMEVSLSASGEVSEPARTIPRALVLAMVTVTTLYVLIQIVAQGILGASLEGSTAPLADAMARLHPGLRILLVGGAALSMFGWVGSDILGSPRVLFAFARDGLLPRVLGRVHPRRHTPHVAILCYAVMAIGLALTGTFAELAVLAALTSAALYIAACIAAWRLAARGVAMAGPPLNFPWLRAAMVTGVACMLVLIALASPAEILGLFALIGVGAVIYAVQSRSGRARRELAPPHSASNGPAEFRR